RELCRVCSALILCSINVDNPYRFHPTILSRESWIAIFESIGLARFDRSQTDSVNSRIRTLYSEYEFFVFRRADGVDARRPCDPSTVGVLAADRTARSPLVGGGTRKK